MTTEERLKKIAEIGKRNEEHKISIENERKEKWAKVQADIKSLAERIKQLVEIANTLCANDIHLGKQKYSCGLRCDEFYTEGTYHELGFVPDGGYGSIFLRDFIPVVGIGIIGGGCDGYDLVVNAEGDIVDGLPTKYGQGELGKAQKFINDFDEFEKRVLEYVDSL